ncbi:MAG: hypothetical protein IJC41_00335 [Firmicutes bacterium]|nr:hypothetical protein [Clostridiales bacterium]MBQ4339433.1 hypothetical protein [Bacillota bacterium]
MRKFISVLIALILCISSSVMVFGQNSLDDYSIISPYTSDEGVAYGDNLLISVKVDAGTALSFTVLSYPNYTSADSLSMVPAISFTVEEPVGISENYEKRDRIGFYTRQLNDIEPGLYALRVDSLDGNGNITDTYSKYFIVKPNASKTTTTIYESQPSNKVLFFQSVFKSLFGSTAEE